MYIKSCLKKVPDMNSVSHSGVVSVTVNLCMYAKNEFKKKKNLKSHRRKQEKYNFLPIYVTFSTLISVL